MSLRLPLIALALCFAPGVERPIPAASVSFRGNQLLLEPNALCLADVAAGDFDNNGLADLILLDRSSGCGGPSIISIYLATSPGRFAEPTSFSISANAFHLAVVDVNGDGDGDIVVRRSRSGAVNPCRPR